MPHGKCIDCINYIKSNPNPRLCTCAEKKGYITLNAHKKLFCEYYVFNSALAEIVRKIYELQKHYQKQQPDQEYSQGYKVGYIQALADMLEFNELRVLAEQIRFNELKTLIT